MICTMLRCVRTSFLVFGVLKDTFCFWSFWLTRSSSSSTVVPFSSIMHAFQSAVSCLWSVLCVSDIFLVKSKVSNPSLLQFVFKNSFIVFCKPYYLTWYKFLIIALSLLLNGMLQCRYFVTALKTMILFTNARHVPKTKQNLISIRKLAKNCFKR